MLTLNPYTEAYFFLMNDFKLTLEASLLSSWRKERKPCERINPLVRAPAAAAVISSCVTARGTSGQRAGSRAPHPHLQRVLGGSGPFHGASRLWSRL